MPYLDKDYKIKLLDRLKKSQGKEVNLLENQNLLPRTEPVYTRGVYPLKNVFVLYGVDRMSKKDINYYVLEETVEKIESISMDEPIKEGLANSATQTIMPKEEKGPIEFKRLDTSHLGIVLVDQQKGK